MVRLYGIKNCDSVKKAIRFLKANDIAYELIDFKTDPVDCGVVRPWLQQVEMKTLFNTRGTTYRTLKLKELNLNEEEQLEWLCKENLLIKCQRCHPDATINFPDSWMSHYDASPENFPLVYYVNLFYKILIPSVLGGMGFYVLTDIYRRFIARKKEGAH